LVPFQINVGLSEDSYDYPIGYEDTAGNYCMYSSWDYASVVLAFMQYLLGICWVINFITLSVVSKKLSRNTGHCLGFSQGRIQNGNSYIPEQTWRLLK